MGFFDFLGDVGGFFGDVASGIGRGIERGTGFDVPWVDAADYPSPYGAGWGDVAGTIAADMAEQVSGGFLAAGTDAIEGIVPGLTIPGINPSAREILVPGVEPRDIAAAAGSIGEIPWPSYGGGQPADAYVPPATGVGGFLPDAMIGAREYAAGLDDPQLAGVGGLVGGAMLGAGAIDTLHGAAEGIRQLGGALGDVGSAVGDLFGFGGEQMDYPRPTFFGGGGGGPLNVFHQTPAGNFAPNRVGFQRTPPNPRTGKSKIIGYVAAEVSPTAIRKCVRGEVLRKTRPRRRRPR